MSGASGMIRALAPGSLTEDLVVIGGLGGANARAELVFFAAATWFLAIAATIRILFLRSMVLLDAALMKECADLERFSSFWKGFGRPGRGGEAIFPSSKKRLISRKSPPFNGVAIVL